MIDKSLDEKLKAKAFDRLLNHLSQRNDVQNIDMMNLAGFCRNCLSNWYKDAAETEGHTLSKDQAREIIYGMPYQSWKDRYQKPASQEQQKQFDQNREDQL